MALSESNGRANVIVRIICIMNAWEKWQNLIQWTLDVLTITITIPINNNMQ